MKKTIHYSALLITTLLIIGCSTDDDSGVDGVNNDQIRYIEKVSNGEESVYHYENGKLLKGVGNSSSTYDSYHSAFQVEYEGNKIKKVISSESSFLKPIDFDFDLNDGSYLNTDIYLYNYDGNKLKSISLDVLTNLYWEFFYDNQGRLSESIQYIWGDDYRSYKFFYGSDGKVESYTRTETYTTTFIASGNIILDEKINPDYILWEKFNFIFPSETNGLSNRVIPFFKNNIIEMYEVDNIHYKAQFSYDGDYPIFYKELIPYTSDGKSIEYLD